MDILSKLPFLNSDTEPDDVEISEADAKADRIAFHRAHIRNGPANFKTSTSGQARRAQRRALDSRTRKGRRAQVDNYFETRRLASTVRANLQSAGVLPYVHGRDLDRQQQVVSAAWLVRHFGIENEETGELSFAYFDVLTALGAALKFYGQSIGDDTLQVPEDYVLPIYEQGTEASV